MKKASAVSQSLRSTVPLPEPIAAYEARLLSRGSAFDRFMAGDDDALSPAARRGARLFVGKAACNDCHGGPLLSDGNFHDIGIPQAGPLVPSLVDCPRGGFWCPPSWAGI